jgi:hypothetical protein
MILLKTITVFFTLFFIYGCANKNSNQTTYQANSMNSSSGKSFQTIKYNNGDRYSGEVAGNVPSGYGTYEFINGDKYVGNFFNNKRNGTGTFTFRNGNRFSGNFSDDKFQGFGTFFYFVDNGQEGDRYEGFFNQGLRSGRGTYFYKNGTKVISNYLEGKFNGETIFFYNLGGKYVTNYKNGIEDGKATFYYSDGSIRREENWVNGINTNLNPTWIADKQGCKFWDQQPENKGSIIIEILDGGCKSGPFNGYAIVKWFGNGELSQINQGYFKNGRLNGKGYLQHLYGFTSEYRGNWVDGIREGLGVLVLFNGNKYIGNFKNNYFDGEGVLYNRSGEVINSGIWNQGKLTQSKQLNSFNESAIAELSPPIKNKSVNKIEKINPNTAFTEPSVIKVDESIKKKEKCIQLGLVPGSSDYQKCIN